MYRLPKFPVNETLQFELLIYVTALVRLNKILRTWPFSYLLLMLAIVGGETFKILLRHELLAELALFSLTAIIHFGWIAKTDALAKKNQANGS